MQESRLFVGGLSYEVDDERLREIFSAYGVVESARIITDRMTGRSRGFGFVEMSSVAEAQEAIGQLDGQNVDGRRLTVNVARPPRRRDDWGGGGRGGRSRRW